MRAGKEYTKDLNLTSAKKYLPPHCNIYHYTDSNRIRAFYGKAGVPSHGCSLVYGQDTACRIVLEFLWKVHKQRNPDANVPFEFKVNWKD